MALDINKLRDDISSRQADEADSKEKIDQISKVLSEQITSTFEEDTFQGWLQEYLHREYLQSDSASYKLQIRLTNIYPGYLINVFIIIGHNGPLNIMQKQFSIENDSDYINWNSNYNRISLYENIAQIVNEELKALRLNIFSNNGEEIESSSYEEKYEYCVFVYEFRGKITI